MLISYQRGLPVLSPPTSRKAVRAGSLFFDYPKTKLVVEAISASQPQMGTHHVDGSADGSTPGRVVVATFNYAHRRLISDGWTRDQAVTYFRESGDDDEPTIQVEIDRYIALPAQSLSYKIGQLKIRELRARAQQQLGPRFDIRKFHDEMLSAGSLPMDMLDARINGWIKSEQAAGEKPGPPQTGS
jgi:uncharacterized protein (DUF885 family)